MNTVIFEFDGGDVTFVDDPEARALAEPLRGVRKRRRASHILPFGLAKLCAFLVIRRVFGDAGWLADWTRRWRGQHLADMRPVGGPILGPYPSRAAALAGERSWLRINIGI